MSKKYSWKRQWDAKGVDPTTAIKAFKKVEKQYGKLTADTLLEYSRNPKSELHTIFTWDDTEAAEQWRKQQSRLIINNLEIVVISDGKPYEVGAYEIVRNEAGERSYKNISIMVKDEIEQVREDIIVTLMQVQKKLKIYRRFDNIVFELERITKELTEA